MDKTTTGISIKELKALIKTLGEDDWALEQAKILIQIKV